ncbi:sigma-70 family RNA polymerase sigma factor [Nocardioides sp. SOB77]|uniref:Sigma-70 family RNA polymerase sigma factor n=1 Tax=Nocardioides oceani TaxID=3058369 RepID=A0ABT8FD93_9ACTN|nr:sigma-70 family RNA polymerase sigma factor [Nocardioides oceani]MDN4172657.1 sigma-70 family RNA polymerase sigma factor [Nocardioides oceani]
MDADDELIARAKGGDQDAWRQLYAEHAGRLVVWLQVRPSGDSAMAADDVASEAWLTAATKIHEFTGTGEQFAGWLFGIARNVGMNARRKTDRRRTDPVGEEHAHEQVEAPETYLVGKDWVRQVLAQLPPRERDVIGCLEVVGLDVEATARALDISAVAVRVARHRGLRRLRGLGALGDEVDARQGSAASSASRNAGSGGVGR